MLTPEPGFHSRCFERYRKKAEKDDEYKGAVRALGPIIARCMKQNNTIDIYQQYFDGKNVDHSSEPPSAKGLAVFRDPNDVCELRNATPRMA
jgi:dynein intermediate chain 2